MIVVHESPTIELTRPRNEFRWANGIRPSVEQRVVRRNTADRQSAECCQASRNLRAVKEGNVAETAKGTKWIRVKSYERADGTTVPSHDRSTPSTSKGPRPRSPKRPKR